MIEEETKERLINPSVSLRQDEVSTSNRVVSQPVQVAPENKLIRNSSMMSSVGIPSSDSA